MKASDPNRELNANESRPQPKQIRWQRTFSIAIRLTLLIGTLCLTSGRAAGPISLTLKGTWPGHARGVAVDVAVRVPSATLCDGGGGRAVIFAA
jgi:hypothetical protein